MSEPQSNVESARPVKVDADGTIHVPAFALPLSAALSPQARQAQIHALTNAVAGLPSLDHIRTQAEFVAYVDNFRRNLDEGFIRPLSDGILNRFPVDVRATEIAGVPVEEFTPSDQVDERRVLINLHGGAFFSGAIYVARVESAPLASIGKVKVVSVNYRQGYEHKFPAASEDVAAVYGELLKAYSPENIGIYGCSAGGHLTAQATAWIIDKGLPRPGAIGIFSSGAGGGGDSIFFGPAATGNIPPPVSAADEFLAGMRSGEFGYLSAVKPDDPLAFPASASKDFLAKFPPTLLITAGRAFDMSPAINIHRKLIRAGVDASLHVFDGLGHCFYYGVFSPEAVDAYDVMVRFFEKNLGSA
jgi:monoterpene epsilon-lactone hydrolase